MIDGEVLHRDIAWLTADADMQEGYAGMDIQDGYAGYDAGPCAGVRCDVVRIKRITQVTTLAIPCCACLSVLFSQLSLAAFTRLLSLAFRAYFSPFQLWLTGMDNIPHQPSPHP